MDSEITAIACLPNEIILSVLTNLSGKDLKSARLVCQSWSILAITKLFRCVYLSSRSKDLEVINQITSHEHLRRAAKELIYDSSVFEESAATNIDDYCLGFFDHRQKAKYSSSDVYNTLSPDIRECIQKCLRSLEKERLSLFSFHERKRLRMMQRYDFIQGGHQVYQKLARQEFDIRRKGEYLRLIISGLQNLSNLEQITMCNDPASESPFGRL